MKTEHNMKNLVWETITLGFRIADGPVLGVIGYTKFLHVESLHISVKLVCLTNPWTKHISSFPLWFILLFSKLLKAKLKTNKLKSFKACCISYLKWFLFTDQQRLLFKLEPLNIERTGNTENFEGILNLVLLRVYPMFTCTHV